MSSRVKLSLLDFFSDPQRALEVGRAASALGFRRFWIGEHHTVTQCPNPLLQVAALASLTRRIRLGSGATSVMLRSPYGIAEDAHQLFRLVGHRFELALSAGTASDGRTVLALTEGRAPESRTFPDRVLEVEKRLAELASLTAPGDCRLRPVLWVVGTRRERAELAADIGAGYCTSFHHGVSIEDVTADLATYRRMFRSSAALRQPRTIVVVSGSVGSPATSPESASGRVELSGSPESWIRGARPLAKAVRTDELMLLPQGSQMSVRRLSEFLRKFISQW